jgi:putative oxidoreductase
MFLPVRWAPIPLRLILGYGFVKHGYEKVASGPDSFIHILQALGMPMPALLGWATIVVELLGGAAVLLGAFIVPVSLPIMIILLVAIAVLWPNGFTSINLQAVTSTGTYFGPPGYEIDLLYLICLVSLTLSGSGPFSIDALIARRRRSKYSTPDAQGPH